MSIYFEMDYAKIYEKNDEGKAERFYLKTKFGEVKYIFLKREIKLLEKKYFDIVTPYGYGGPQFFPNREDDLEKLLLEFKENFEKYCSESSIISEFIRFHPLKANHKLMENYMEIKSISSTVFIELEETEKILSNIDPKCRNKIRKAKKNNVVVRQDVELNTLENFKILYDETMQKNNASNYYYFGEDYFNNTKKLLKDNITIFNAYQEEEILASTMVLKGNDSIHYHLSANTSLGYKIAANNLLLFEVANWGFSEGFKKFHLGGGYGGDESPLFKFKKSFNKNGVLDFYIGKKIHDENIYCELNRKLEEAKPEISGQNENFFPLYRRTI